MADQNVSGTNEIPDISMANTKKEMLQAYQQLKEKLEAQAEEEKHIDTLSKQMDTAYGKVQEIAVKAVSGKSQEVLQPFSREHREQTEGGHKG